MQINFDPGNWLPRFIRVGVIAKEGSVQSIFGMDDHGLSMPLRRFSVPPHTT
jgi:hypothetical protein